MTILCHMVKLTRRSFLKRGTAATVTAGFLATRLNAYASALKSSSRILVGTGKGEGSGSIVAFHWDAATGTLTPEGEVAQIADSTWLELSPDRKYVYVASELSEFQGKPTGAVSSYKFVADKLQVVNQVNTASAGTCHVGVDQTGNVLVAADYGGGSASSFVSQGGKLNGPQWSEHYGGYEEKGAPGGKGPVADRQEAAHAHFASFSPDNRFAFVNDLGGDLIHIYNLDSGSGNLVSSGAFNAKPGSGPRTLHFHPNGKVAYCMNELDSSVDVLAWSASDRSLDSVQRVSLLPAGEDKAVVNTGCDTVLTKDGKFAYFANRGHDFLVGYAVEGKTGKLTLLGEDARVPSGGKTPRNFRLDPTENWVIVANQNSGNLTVIARDAKTGLLAKEGKNVPCPKPMCVVFV